MTDQSNQPSEAEIQQKLEDALKNSSGIGPIQLTEDQTMQMKHNHWMQTLGHFGKHFSAMVGIGIINAAEARELLEIDLLLVEYRAWRENQKPEGEVKELAGEARLVG